MAPSQFTVAILPLGDVPALNASLTARALQQEFGVDTVILPSAEIPTDCCDAEHGRYKDYLVLDFLFYKLPDEAQRIMGVMAAELENDKGEHLHGASRYFDGVAIHSVLPSQKRKALSIRDTLNKDERAYIVSAHEFGHTLGLPHCQKINCLMYEASQVTKMCAACRKWTDRELTIQLGSAEERFFRAQSMYTHNCLPQATALYRQAIHRAPDEPLYHQRLSRVMHKLEMNEQEKENLRLAIKLSRDDHPQSYYISGLMCLGNPNQMAEKFFAKALEVAKDPQNMHRLIGQAYREILHDVERASRHYKEYLQLGGNDQDVIDWLVSRSQL